MITRIYYWLHRLASKPQERGRPSAGYWQDKVRQEALILCQGIKGRLLEVGCGEGLFLEQLTRQNPELEIWGIDNNNERLNQAEQRIKGANLKNIRLLFQDATSLSFADEYFDTVICINVLLSLDSLDLVRQVLGQMKQVCRKSGKIIFEFRNSLNPLLVVKYRLARYYDETVKNLNLPLRCYGPKQIESILKDLNLKVKRKIPLGLSIFKRFAPIIILEVERE